MWSAAVLRVPSYQVEQSPTASPALCTAQERHSMSFVRYLWGSAWARIPTRRWERIQGREPACTNHRQIVITHQFQRPLDFVRSACHPPAVITGYLWLSHSASKIVSDSAYEEPHDNAAPSLHGAAPAPARVNSNERPSLCLRTRKLTLPSRHDQLRVQTSEMPTVARLPARRESRRGD